MTAAPSTTVPSTTTPADGAPVVARAHAKINLALRVGAARPDGYHPLVSVFEAIDLAETVTAHPRPAGTPLTCAVAEDSPYGAGLGTGADNLLVRAGEAVAAAMRAHGREPGSAHLVVRKEIPVAAGLAGGSADAVAALLACDALWGAGLGREDLHELARGLGADVPFALDGGVAIGVDRGDRLTAVVPAPGTAHHWVLAVSGRGLSTPAVFRHLDARGDAPATPAAADDLAAALRGSGGPCHPVDLAPLLVNDLTEPALDLRPDLGDTFAAAERAGALATLLCGSGPTIAALCLDRPHAESVASVLRGAEVASDVLVVRGPVTGAALV